MPPKRLHREPQFHTTSIVTCCGVCGTDAHIHEGEFIAKFPVSALCIFYPISVAGPNYMHPPQLIPGHEAIGKVVEVGKKVKDFQIGDRVVADVGISVNTSFIRFLS